MSKKLKEDLIETLLKSLTNSQWETISSLLNRPIPSSDTKRKNLLSRLFKKTISIQSRKGKARDLQNWVCEQISKITSLKWGKDEHIASREMGQSGVDIRLSPYARKLFPFSIECKSEKKWNIFSAIKQAKGNQFEETNWLVFFKRVSAIEDERVSPIVVLDAEVFFNLLKPKEPIKLIRRQINDAANQQGKGN